MAEPSTSSLRAATYLLLTQLSTRLLTFVANQLLLRYISPALLAASVQLELYSTSILYFSRESLRVALQRQSPTLQSIVNVAYIPIFLGAFFANLFGWLYARDSGNGSSLPDVPFTLSVLKVYGAASVLELCAEPCFALTAQTMRYDVRAAAETSAAVVRCAVVFGATVWASNVGMEVGVLPFAAGQAAYAVCLVLVYVWKTSVFARAEGCSLFLRRIQESKEKNGCVLLESFSSIHSFEFCSDRHVGADMEKLIRCSIETKNGTASKSFLLR